MISWSPSSSGARFDDALVVEERAVAALQVFDEEVVPLAEDGGMAAAHGGHIERHLAVAVAADDRPVAIDREPRARGCPVNKF